jgi:hypothetical protein
MEREKHPILNIMRRDAIAPLTPEQRLADYLLLVEGTMSVADWIDVRNEQTSHSSMPTNNGVEMTAAPKDHPEVAKSLAGLDELRDAGNILPRMHAH